MALGCDPVRVTKTAGKATGGIRVGGGSPLNIIMTDAAGRVPVSGITVSGPVIRGIIIAALPAGGMGTGIRVAGGSGASRGSGTAIKTGGTGYPVTLLAGGQIGFGSTTMVPGSRIGDIMGGIGRSPGMTSGGVAVAVGIAVGKTGGSPQIGSCSPQMIIVADDTGDVLPCGIHVGCTIPVGGAVGFNPVRGMGPGVRMTPDIRTAGVGQIEQALIRKNAAVKDVGGGPVAGDAPVHMVPGNRTMSSRGFI